jgi:hypothetical protein
MGHSLKAAEQGTTFTHPPLGQVDEVVVGPADITYEPIELPGLSTSASFLQDRECITQALDGVAIAAILVADAGPFRQINYMATWALVLREATSRGVIDILIEGPALGTLHR